MKQIQQLISVLAIFLFLMSCTLQVPEEKEGLLMVEAEEYDKQELDSIRSWMRFDPDNQPIVSPDSDGPHLDSASNNAYLEILPDTRATHDDKLIRGENFMPYPGKMGVLFYQVKINTPGRYYVWARIFSTGTEDNGLHVGLNGSWPESGQRMQWCEGKNRWTWASKQRTEANHCGEEKLIYLDIDTPGIHTIQFSMREDGTEFDAWAITTDYESFAANHK